MNQIPFIMLLSCLYEHQKKAIEQQNKYKKCLINMWCGTGKTRTFTIDLFMKSDKNNVIVFPSLGLINQYCNDYALSREEPFKTEFEKYNCLAFCSDDDGKLKSKGEIKFTTDERKLNTFIKKKDKKIILVTYQSFEKFINICINKNININNLIFDEAHHIVGDKIQDIVFNNQELDAIVDKTRFYTATPINRNGITMYDRDDHENSDCGELAYEYLYYQAVQDGICKPFETQINLYTQKPEYKDKYQPVFESIIRACLSGKYEYWNILTYHSFVNENEDMNNNISFVKEFASPKNQKLVKNLFTRIQNNEFHHTKELYSVENVILKGVHSKTPTRQQIIQDFDRKVKGRIYILSSCGILNEGIDTKWANMGVPINPTKSIVKESQRIGRLVRIPEEGMPPAIILIPCEVDVTKYSSMDTAEHRDKMIREELSESGNFNTALNVISAFKYQYDPDLFEMCLRYPNMYAPKEVKDNLEKQGLIVEESQGDLLENLKYLCEKERIELDTESFEGENEQDILKEVADLCEKTIEIHTQNHDEPVKYINEDVSDEEPLRLFYCEDDNTYAPIVKKDKKQRIKRKSTIPPKKRPKLFDVHQHPDLEVLWKIKESSIDLNKTFSQGVLDVDINWNEKKWNEKLKKTKEFMDTNNARPNSHSKNKDEKVLANWISNQVKNYKTKRYIMKNPEIYSAWSEFIHDPAYSEHFASNEEQWHTSLKKTKEFMDTNNARPKDKSKNKDEKVLGNWISNQVTNYKTKRQIMKNPEIYSAWSEFIHDPAYSEHFANNEEQWHTSLKKTKEFMDTNNARPNQHSKNKDEKVLGQWISQQVTNYKTKRYIMKNPEIYSAWSEFIHDPAYSEHFANNEEQWHTSLKKVKEFMDTNNARPSQQSKNKDEKVLGKWISHQVGNYKTKIKIMKNPEIYSAWSEFIHDPNYSKYFNRTSKPKAKKDMSKPEIKPKKKKETKEQRQQRFQSELSQLHQKYKTMDSQNLNTEFKDHPEEWEKYHKISKENEKSFPEEEIPRNKMIKYLENLPGKKKKIVADLGCGFAEINQHFRDNSRFEFHNFDHHSSSEFVVSRDIKNTELDDYSVDIAILSLAMWGSNCKDYLEEAYRILDTGGTLLIAEAYTRWNKELDEHGKPVNRLVKWLEENNFTIIKNDEQKFMFIECRKN